MIKKLMMLCVAAMGVMSALAATETVNGITWTYTVSGGEATLTRVSSSISGTVVVPTQLGGFPLVGIGEEVFLDCKKIISVVIGEGVRFLDEAAFENCEKLQSVSLPSTLNSIEYDVWEGCCALQKILLPNGSPYFVVDGGVLYNKNKTVLYRAPVGMKQISIPITVKEIAYCAFEWGNLHEIDIPDSVSIIGRHAFGYCKNLERVKLPQGIMYDSGVEGNIFDSCTRLSEVEIMGGNLIWREGALYADMGADFVLVSLPNAQGCYQVADDVTIIGREAIQHLEKLTAIVFSKTVRIIGEELGSECPLLKAMIFQRDFLVDDDDEDLFWKDFSRVIVPVDMKSRMEKLIQANGLQRTKVMMWSNEDELMQYINTLNQFVGTPEINSSYGPFVPGAAVELNLGLVGYTAKKLPSGLKLDKKTGIVKGKAKKPGEYQATFTKKGAETLTAKFIVGPMPTITIMMEGDTEKCKVTGASKPGMGYLVGKKVSLSAKGPKGTAFTGWFKDGAPWPNETEYLESKLKYVMTEANLSLVARFEKEKMSVSCDGLSALAVGEEVSIPIAIETQSGVKSVTGSKLPTGLKVKKDKATGEWFVTGKPKKVGAWNSVIKVTAKSGAVEQLPVTVIVEDKGEVVLPSANHYFREPLKNGEGEKYVVSVGISNVEEFLPSLELNSPTAKLAVSGLPEGLKYDATNGKITGVATKPGTYTVTLTVTDGKEKYVSTIAIEVEALPDWVVGTFEGYAYIECLDMYDDFHDRIVYTISSDGRVLSKGQVESGSWYTLKNNQLLKEENGNFRVVSMEPEWDFRGERSVCITPEEIDGIVVGLLSGVMEGEDYEEEYDYWNSFHGDIYACQNVWKIAQGTRLTPALVKNSTTSVSMSRMRDDDWDPYYGGYLTLKYGANGAVTTAYSETEGGKATATGSAQLVPYEVDGNITKAWLYTALKPKGRDAFGVLLFLSIDTSKGNVYGDDVTVDDYLLELD